jgi:hypothetical protein
MDTDSTTTEATYDLLNGSLLSVYNELSSPRPGSLPFVDHNAELCVDCGGVFACDLRPHNETDGLWAYAISAIFSRRVICYASHERERTRRLEI